MTCVFCVATSATPCLAEQAQRRQIQHLRQISLTTRSSPPSSYSGTALTGLPNRLLGL